MNVTSPKAILGAISNAAGFSNPTRQQLERSLSQEKVASRAALPSAAPSLEGSSRDQHAWPLPPCLLQQGSEHSFPQETASCFSMSNNIFVHRWMLMVERMTGHQGTTPAHLAQGCRQGAPRTAPQS